MRSNPPDWTRFLYYSRRVRQLTIMSIGKPAGIEAAILTFVSGAWPSSNPFSALTSVYFNCDDRASTVSGNPQMDLRLLPLFVNDSVNALFVYREDPSIAESRAVLRSIRECGHSLKELSFAVHHKSPKLYERNVMKLLGSLKELKYLILAVCLFTPNALFTLATLPSLSSFGLHLHYDHPSAPRRVCNRKRKNLPTSASYREALKAGSLDLARFQALALQGPLGFVTDTLTLIRSSGGLTVLTVDMLSLATVESVKDFISRISVSCPNLEKLRLVRTERANARALLQAELEPVTVQTLQPLIEVKRLSAFKLMHTQPAHISDVDLVGWVSRCKSLRELHLTHAPLNTLAPVTLTLGVLPHICAMRPEMMALSLCVDIGTTLTFVAQSGQSFSNMHHFNRLRHLNLGLSPIPAQFMNKMVLFLREILPLGQQLAAELDNCQIMETLDENLNQRSLRQKRWVIVSRRLATTMELRIAHQKKLLRSKPD